MYYITNLYWNKHIDHYLLFFHLILSVITSSVMEQIGKENAPFNVFNASLVKGT